MLKINDLLREKEDDRKRVGKSVWGNIDKTGFFYHVVTKSWNGAHDGCRDGIIPVDRA